MLTSRLSRSLFLLLCPAVAMAQTATPASGITTLQVSSRIVYVDIVVHDGSGHLVRGLTQKDFQIFEDGKPQKIDYFADHTHDASPPVERPANDLEFSNVGPTSNSVNIILFDFYNTASQDQLYARKQMIRFLEALPPGHQTALFVLSTRLHMLQTFTGSTDRLLAAAKSMKLVSSTAKTIGEEQQGRDFVSAFIAAMGRSASPQNAVSDGEDLGRGQELQSAMNVTGEALNEIAAAVSGYPGRKNLYWLADRFPLFGGPALEIHELAGDITGATTIPQQISGGIKDIPGILNTQDMAEANQGLADAQIAVYPIALTGVEASGMGPEARGMTSAQQLFTQRAALHDIMDNLRTLPEAMPTTEQMTSRALCKRDLRTARITTLSPIFPRTITGRRAH